jgi:hypothetical protein
MLPPSIAFPIHDPDGLIIKQLVIISPFLQQHFSTVFIGVTKTTFEKYQVKFECLMREDFCHLRILPQDAQVGRQFWFLFQQAATLSHPQQILHLCYPDRLAFALQNQYRDQFLADIKSLKPENTPIIFQRSQKAWDTHPSNHFEIERYVTTISKYLFGKTDFAWCHMAIPVQQLKQILKAVRRHDLSMVAEMIIPLIDIRHYHDLDCRSEK